MKFELEPDNRNSSNEELLNDLKRVAVEIGKDKVTIDEYNERGRFHSTTLTRRFGNWFKALDRAGLSKTRNLNLTEEELFENLEHAWISIGRQPRYDDMIAPHSKYSAGTYENRFGSWRSALERFVIAVNTNRPTDEGAGSPTAPELRRRRTKRDPNWRLRFLVMRRDNFKCVSCGRSPSTHPNLILEVDHVRAWDKEGETVMENLQTLCQQCNGGKGNLDFREPSAE
jgi:hypothetical protein